MSEELDGLFETLENDLLSKYEYNLLLNYITNLQNKYNKALELLSDFNMPCENDDFMNIHSDYCEKNCSVDNEIFKKCWNKFIEWKIKDE